MKRILSLVLLAGFVVASNPFSAEASDKAPSEESVQIQILQSPNATAQQKREACARLKQIGTKNSVDALAALLTDEQMSLAARYALESMPNSKAERALIAALPKTSGALQAGIIDSLGMRDDTDAVKPLGKLLASSDAEIAVASARALGRIGGSKSLHLLEDAAVNPGPAHQAEIDSLLICANRLLDEHKSKDALHVFEKLYASEKSDTVRKAAFHGILFASGDSGIPLMMNTILDGDSATQGAALLAAAQWPSSKQLTAALSDALPKAPAPVQLALIQCCIQRGETGAAPALAKLTDDSDSGVALAAISSLGPLGNDSFVELLAEKAASGNAARRNAARKSLQLLNHGDVTGKMLALLKTAQPAEKSELMSALGARQDKAAVPVLLEIAQNGKEAERTAAFQALGQLAGTAEIPTLVKLVVNARADDVRLGAADALNSVFQRTQSTNTDLRPFVSAVQTGNTETRLALLPICSEVAQEPVRRALRAAVADGDANIRDAGVHALCDTKDAGLLPDLLKLAHDTNQAGIRLLAIRGCVRVATQEDGIKLSNAEKMQTLNAILETPLNQQEKQVVLSGLGKVGDLKALEIASGMLKDAEVRPEAEQAVIDISEKIAKPHPNKAKTALRKVAQETSNDQTRKTAQDALKKIK